MSKNDRDAFGHAILDYYLSQGQMRRPYEIIEREDGYIDVDILEHYFYEYRQWPRYERQAIKLAKGRILDIGSGAGRHCLYLQGGGLDVVALDNSPNALEVCRNRGIANTWLSSVEGVNRTRGIFDTVLMLGHNFGLLKDRDNGRKILARLFRITSKRALIIADTGDVRKTNISEHLTYQEDNRKRGRFPGQIKIQIRYKKYRSPWFDYLQASKKEVVEMVTERAGKLRDSSTPMSGPTQ